MTKFMGSLIIVIMVITLTLISFTFDTHAGCVNWFTRSKAGGREILTVANTCSYTVRVKITKRASTWGQICPDLKNETLPPHSSYDYESTHCYFSGVDEK